MRKRTFHAQWNPGHRAELQTGAAAKLWRRCRHRRWRHGRWRGGITRCWSKSRNTRVRRRHPRAPTHARILERFSRLNLSQQICGGGLLLIMRRLVVGDFVRVHPVVNRADTRRKAHREDGAGGWKQKAKWAGHTFLYVILPWFVNARHARNRKLSQTPRGEDQTSRGRSWICISPSDDRPPGWLGSGTCRQRSSAGRASH